MKQSLAADNIEVSENRLAITENHWLKGKMFSLILKGTEKDWEKSVNMYRMQLFSINTYKFYSNSMYP